MDIRIERTDRAIEDAFMELRAKSPLEKIKIKDLCALACINKSTFYAHHEDIYALSDGLEKKVIDSILACVTAADGKRPLDHTETLTQELFRAFVKNQKASLSTASSRACASASPSWTPPFPPIPAGGSCSPSACRAAFTPLPTTAAAWMRPNWWPFWRRSPKRHRMWSCKGTKFVSCNLRRMPRTILVQNCLCKFQADRL